MLTTQLKHPLLVHGPDTRLVYIKFTPDTTNPPIVDEAHGFSPTVGYTSTGIYTATVAKVGAIKDITVLQLSAVPGDANFHELTYAINETTLVVTVTHRTISYATIVSSGPAVSNTCGMITLACLVRVSS